MKLNKDEAFCIVIGLEDECETSCIDGKNIIVDFGHWY